MAGNTSIIGWPYPSSSDLIAEGAVNIEQLADEVEGQFFLAKNAHTVADPYPSYPSGMSMMTVTGSDFPSSSGFAITNTNYAQSCAWQYFYPQTATSENQRAYLRIGFTGAEGPTWSGWQVVASPGTSEEEATGSITITPSAGVPTPVNVTYPSGRFSKNARVFLQYQGTQPQDVSLSTDNRTTSGFRAYIYRPGATSVTFHYYAVVMASDTADN